jgi:hypothetical protein
MSGGQQVLESSEISNTAALLERLTQIVTLQQTQMSQLMSLHQTSQQIIPTAPTLVTTEGSSSHILVKLAGSNYSIWSKVVKMHLKGRDKMRYVKP